MAFDTLCANVIAEVGQMKAQLDQLHSENTRLRNRLVAIEQATPACFPDGTGVLLPEQWIAWAKRKLGYAHGVPETSGGGTNG